MSICKECQNKRDVWSHILKDKGYIGCSVLYNKVTALDLSIEAESLSKGWIKANNGNCIGEMLITQGVKSCNFFSRED